jgi:hypothetical protein
VEAKSVFLKGAAIQRPLSDKELSQLMDLREDWAPSLIHVLLEWDSGASPPLQMSVEFILLAFLWLGLDSGHALQEDDASLARKKPNESFSGISIGLASAHPLWVRLGARPFLIVQLSDWPTLDGFGSPAMLLTSPRLPRLMMLRPILPYGILVVTVLGWSMHVPLFRIGYIRDGGG